MLYRTELCLLYVSEGVTHRFLVECVDKTVMPMPLSEDGEFLGYCTSLCVRGDYLVADAMINMPESNP